MKKNLVLKKITTTTTNDEDGESMSYNATFISKDADEDFKLSISQEEEFDLVVGEEYTINITTEQTKLQ